MTGTEQGKASKDLTHFPGDEMIWLFILGDMATFSLFFCAFGYWRAEHLELFRDSQTLLNLHYGALNTLLLLASSWFVVMALQAARRGVIRLSSNLLVAAIACGVGFSISKIFEYKAKFAADISFTTNDFFSFYYLLTGIHFAHLLCGLGILGWFVWTVRHGEVADEDLFNLESGAIFWHMVDLLWIVIFTLLYLLP